jgi:hypothetical protein
VTLRSFDRKMMAAPQIVLLLLCPVYFIFFVKGFPMATCAIANWRPPEKLEIRIRVGPLLCKNWHSGYSAVGRVAPGLIPWRRVFEILGSLNCVAGCMAGFFRDDPHDHTSVTRLISAFSFGYPVDRSGDWVIPYLGSLSFFSWSPTWQFRRGGYPPAQM